MLENVNYVLNNILKYKYLIDEILVKIKLVNWKFLNNWMKILQVLLKDGFCLIFYIEIIFFD